MKIPNVRSCIFSLTLSALAATAAAATADTPAPTPVADGATMPAAAPATPAATATPAAPTVALTGSAGVVPLQVTPEASKEVTLNLARWYTGASLIEMTTAGGLNFIPFENRDDSQYSPLLEEDSTVGVPFKSGMTHLMIDLGPQQTTLKTFGFFSFGAVGSAELFYASGNTALRPNSNGWKAANIKKDFKANEAIHADIIAEARFVMININLTTPGEIGALEMFGTRIVSSTVAPKQTDQKKTDVTDESNTIDFDYALQGFGAKVTQVDGGNATQANRVLDTNLQTSFTLGDHSKELAAVGNTSNITSNTDVDLNNILVVDMGQQRTINKVALLFQTGGSGNFDFYLLDDLPVNPDANAATLPPPAAAPTDTPAATPTPAPAAMNFAPAAPAFFASHSSSVLRALLFAQIGAADVGTPGKIDYLPKNFFQQYKPSFTQGVAADTQRVSHDLTKLPCRFCLIRWVPTNPMQPPLQVYKVNLIGKVAVQDFVNGSKDNARLGGLVVPGIGSPTPTNIVHLSTTTPQGGGGPPSTPPTNPGGDPTPTSGPNPTPTPPAPPTNPLPPPTPTPVTPTPDNSPPTSA